MKINLKAMQPFYSDLAKKRTFKYATKEYCCREGKHLYVYYYDIGSKELLANVFYQSVNGKMKPAGIRQFSPFCKTATVDRFYPKTGKQKSIKEVNYLAKTKCLVNFDESGKPIKAFLAINGKEKHTFYEKNGKITTVSIKASEPSKWKDFKLNFLHKLKTFI